MTKRAMAFPHPSPSHTFHAFFRHWGGLLALCSIVGAALLLGISLRSLNSRIQRVETTLALTGKELTALRQSMDHLRTALAERPDEREVSREGLEGVLVRMVAIEASLASLSKEIGTTKKAMSEAVKAMKSETGKMRTELQNILTPRGNESHKMIKEALAKETRRPDEHKKQQKR